MTDREILLNLINILHLYSYSTISSHGIKMWHELEKLKKVINEYEKEIDEEKENLLETIRAQEFAIIRTGERLTIACETIIALRKKVFNLEEKLKKEEEFCPHRCCE